MNASKNSRLALVLTTLLLLITFHTTVVAEKHKRSAAKLTRVELKEAESKLSEMGYRTGRVDGAIDDATRRALVLFQKWEGRKVTGSLNRDEFDAIMNATAPAPKDTGYRHVEVDLDRQLLLL